MRVTDDSGAVLSCPVCGQPMQRGRRYRVQVLREEEQPVGGYAMRCDVSSLACPRCAEMVRRLLLASIEPDEF